MTSSSDRIHVVFCRTESDQFTGAPKMLLRLAKNLNPEQFETTILTQRESELTRRAQDQGIRTKIIPYRGILDSYQRSLLTTSITGKIRTGIRIGQYNIEAQKTLRDADIVWCDGTRTLLTVLPTILTFHITTIWNVGLARASDGVDKYINEVCFRIADHVFIESETQAKRAFGTQYERFKSKFTVFHKGIDTDKFSPQSDPSENDIEVCIGTAGSLIPRKGHLDFLKAVRELVDRGYDLQVLIAGGTPHKNDSEYKNQLERYVDKHDLEDIVDFCGWINDDSMSDFYNSLDVFVLASHSEGIPGVVREAMACETAVVATDVGGTSDVVIDGKTGYLVSPNSPSELVNRLEQLITNSELRSTIAASGRQNIIDQFSIESYIDNYQEFLRNI